MANYLRKSTTLNRRKSAGKILTKLRVQDTKQALFPARIFYHQRF